MTNSISADGAIQQRFSIDYTVKMPVGTDLNSVQINMATLRLMSCMA